LQARGISFVTYNPLPTPKTMLVSTAPKINRIRTAHRPRVAATFTAWSRTLFVRDATGAAGYHRNQHIENELLESAHKPN
jgi:hypothetical protein